MSVRHELAKKGQLSERQERRGWNRRSWNENLRPNARRRFNCVFNLLRWKGPGDPRLRTMVDRPLPSWISYFKSTPDDSQQRVSWSPSDNLVQYVPHEVFEMMAFAMNTTHVQETRKSLETSVEELKMFFGISLTMSCLCYPQIRMCWMKKARMPLVADNMTKNLYFQLRHRLKLVNELDVSEEEKEKDRLWRIRPLVSFLLEGCHKLLREENVSIDEQMILFSG
ncbi:hypothetical protein HPB51_011344 [Rhipicephalus microplus]|uniref:PiggyBac transposable element-derived protein domain-containing protein n=1 Tax=Rhipicephalus microplus TaxID=6941 RepID=A0A9J6D515_RHIMP|nr:hypothetical protein HPB51_011344 [Rhipicephalus microplus]